VRGVQVIYTHAAAGLIGAVIAALGVWQVQDWRYNARIALMQEAHETSLRKASEAARVQEQKLVEARQKVEVDYAQHKKRAAVAAAGAQSELSRLRDALAAPSAGAAGGDTRPAERVDGVAGLERELLGQCATAFVAMAAEADRLKAAVIGLQGYVREVCLARR
jgi:hypothetical protein